MLLTRINSLNSIRIFNVKSFASTSFLFVYFCFPPFTLLAEWDSPLLGEIKTSASTSATYDSRVFGIPSSYYNKLKTDGSNPGTGIPVNELKSEDDFIIKFSPAVHLSQKVSLLKFSGSAGVEIAQYIKNEDKSYVVPVTTFSVDFDETLSKNKRISNNAKIRFEAVFDLGQKVSASVLEQDLTSYSYFTVGMNVRYNHSRKFGVSSGTNYSIQHYQVGSTGPRPYQDFSTLPLNFRAFYIYSEKLDIYTNYTFSRSKSKGDQPNLIDSKSHLISFGVNGDYSSKLSGDANIGYTLLTFDHIGNPDQDNLTVGLGLSYKYNSKTSSTFSLNRSFSPSAQGFSTFTTSARTGLSHRFVESVSGSAYLSASTVDYSYPASDVIVSGESSSMNTYGFGFSVTKNINKYFNASGSYDYSIIDRNSDSYGRHIIQALLTGSF